MPVYEYRAKNESGQPVNGTLFSTTLTTAADALSQQGLHVEHVQMVENPGDPLVEAAKPRESYAEIPRPQVTPSQALFGGVPLTDLQFFYRQLGTLLHAGVGLVQALHTLASQTSNEKLKVVIHDMRAAAEAGRPMTEGMARHPAIFTPLLMSLTRAGEASGQLDSAMKQAATYLGREIELRRLYKRATLYPKLVLAASIIVVLGANWIIGMVAPGGQTLSSPLTNPLIGITVVLLVVGIFLYLRVGLQNPSWKLAFDRNILRIPYLGNTLHQLAMAKFGRGMGALYRAGVPVHNAVQLGADACGNQHLRQLMYGAIHRLKEGHGITDTLRDTGAFSPIVLDMTRTGEATGNVDSMLDSMADYYEQEAETRSHQLGTATGVAVMLLVAIYVGYVYITNAVAILGGRVSDGLME